MRRKSRRIIITVDIPEDATLENVADFCFDALETMGGCYHPDDPMFESLNVKMVAIGQQSWDYNS